MLFDLFLRRVCRFLCLSNAFCAGILALSLIGCSSLPPKQEPDPESYPEIIKSLNEENSRLKKEVEDAKHEIRRNKEDMINHLDDAAKRMRAIAIRNVLELIPASIPFSGPAVILTITTYDINDICDTMTKSKRLKRRLGGDIGGDEKKDNEICGSKLPSLKELKEKARESIKKNMNPKEFGDELKEWWKSI